MKYLVLLVVIVVAYLLWRNARLRDDRTTGPRPGTKPGNPQEMVSCPVCGVHLPRGDAVPDAQGILYCSTEHRRLRAGG